MKIGIDARFYGTLGKGLGRYTEKLLEGLEKIDTANEYVIFLRQENFNEYQPKNPRFTKVIADFQWYGWREQIFFPRLLNRFHLDLVHFPHFNVPLLYKGPFIVTIHDLILLHYPTIKASELPPFLYWGKYLAYRFTISTAIRRARVILTVSHFTRKDIERSYPFSKEKICVTLEATDPMCAFVPPAEAGDFLQKMNLLLPEKDGENGILPKVRPFFLYVGNAYPHKNLSLILEAAKVFPEKRFVLVGKEDFFYRELKRKAEHRKLTNIFFDGFVADRFLDVLYQKALVYLFPSWYEGFGLPGLEAYARGLPVLASNQGSLPEVLGDAALYFHPQDTQTFLTLLKRIMTDERERERLRARGYIVERQYSWERLAEETQAQYKKSLPNKK